MVTGPYIAFGVETEENSLMKTANGKPTKVRKEDFCWINRCYSADDVRALCNFYLQTKISLSFATKSARILQCGWTQLAFAEA